MTVTTGNIDGRFPPYVDAVPDWEKVSHTSFSARDKEECARFFERVLGFRRFEVTSGDGWSAVLLLHPRSGTVMEFQQHDANEGEPFDPTRTGIDHLGFQVASRAALDEWQRHFEAEQVDFTPVVEQEYGAVLTFRDPDARQFEMFFRKDHP
jgi:glyoxylase I family protein